MRARIVIGLGAIALGLGVAVSAVLGPLVLDIIRFRTSRALEMQFVGGEIISLVIVAPLAIAGGVLWLRGHPVAPAISLGPALYAIYTYLTVVVGQEYARYPGNVERFFPLFAGLFALGVGVALASWARLASSEPGMPGDGLRRLLGSAFIALGTFFGLAWIAQIRLVLGGQPTLEYEEGPTLFWTIKLLDLGFVLPVLISTGIGLLRRQRWAVIAAYGLATFSACLTLAVAGMAIAMQVTGDPSAQPVLLGVALVVGLGLAGLTAWLLRPMIGVTESSEMRRAAGGRESLLGRR